MALKITDFELGRAAGYKDAAAEIMKEAKELWGSDKDDKAQLLRSWSKRLQETASKIRQEAEK